MYYYAKVDDSYLDKIRTSYKTADETEENKTKVYIYIVYSLLFILTERFICICMC